MVKKIVLILVEGNDEELILTPIIDALNETVSSKLNVKFKIQSDTVLTSNARNQDPMTIVTNTVKKYMEFNALKAKDILGVFKCIDLDGIFMKETDFEIDDTVKGFEYDVSNQKIKASKSEAQHMLNLWHVKLIKVQKLCRDNATLKINGTNIPFWLHFNNIMLERIINYAHKDELWRQDTEWKQNITQAFIELYSRAEAKGITPFKFALNYFDQYTYETTSTYNALRYVEAHPWAPVSTWSFMLNELEQIIKPAS
ncbi:hypothetical protein [Periweissella fabalis]|uniref:Uncharacterized protein n=1 Tax=Periweissella fabalis TaxID=1070421 RepID=A0A7X6S2R4_9LACO|nr:hypothetical protein [Periweissella fabalis]MCM0599097.1 hypothetical protein [Periweissella fabalis]NKZ23376.1 hypothetical protein [Periweissella fabalis]